jgi:hypothetical protein
MHNSGSFQKLCALLPIEIDPTIITSIWIPPLDYPCQVCQRTDDVDKMLFYDNCNGGYHLFCFKSKLTQVLVDIWHCSSCSFAAL